MYFYLYIADWNIIEFLNEVQTFESMKVIWNHTVLKFKWSSDIHQILTVVLGGSYFWFCEQSHT